MDRRTNGRMCEEKCRTGGEPLRIDDIALGTRLATITKSAFLAPSRDMRARRKTQDFGRAKNDKDRAQDIWCRGEEGKGGT